MKNYRSASMPEFPVDDLKGMKFNKNFTVKESSETRRKIMRTVAEGKLISENNFLREKLKDLNTRLNDLLDKPQNTKKKERKTFDNVEVLQVAHKKVEFYKNEFEVYSKRVKVLDDRMYDVKLKLEIEEKKKKLEELIESKKKSKDNERIYEKVLRLDQISAESSVKELLGLREEKEILEKEMKKVVERGERVKKNLFDVSCVVELLQAKIAKLKLKLACFGSYEKKSGMSEKFKEVGKVLNMIEVKSNIFQLKASIKIKELSLILEKSRSRENVLSQNLSNVTKSQTLKSSQIQSLNTKIPSKPMLSNSRSIPMFITDRSHSNYDLN